MINVANRRCKCNRANRCVGNDLEASIFQSFDCRDPRVWIEFKNATSLFKYPASSRGNEKTNWHIGQLTLRCSEVGGGQTWNHCPQFEIPSSPRDIESSFCIYRCYGQSLRSEITWCSWITICVRIISSHFETLSTVLRFVLGITFD